MPIEQKTFFGASLTSFNCVIGWGNQVSTLEIGLVEDPVNSDAFNPNPIGYPAYFSYYGFSFGGIVQRYGRSGSFSGNPLYRVTLTDPREILNGVQVIIDGYTGSTSQIPNLYNVYGYLENTVGFGSSRVNEAGMSWSLLGNTLALLISADPINFRGQPYYVNFANLPQLPDEYRIGGGNSLSVMDFINEVCEAGACDYFFNLEPGNIITVYTVSRAIQPAFGLINQFIQNTEGAVAHDIGLELRNETTSKFLSGGQVAAMFIQTSSDANTEENFADDTIMQFWGFRDDGDPVIMEYHEEDDGALNHRFTLASRSVDVHGVGDTYDTDLFEMRAALGGQSSWETFLITKKDDADSPHFQKVQHIGIIGEVDAVADVIAAIPDFAAFKAFDIRRLAPLRGKVIRDAGGVADKANRHEENVKRLYDYVLSFAQEYYGRKFMVRVPFVFATLDEDTQQIVTSQVPAEGGFVEESAYPTAIGLGLMPTYTNFVSKPDGRLMCYCRFDDYEELDLSALSEDDYIIDADKVFILCEVEPDLVFLDRATAFSPRAVITLPAPIYPIGDNGNDFIGPIRKLLEDRAVDLAGGPDEAAEIDDIINKMFARLGGEQVMFGWPGIAETPDMVAVPLESKILTYGPWYATGAAGGVEYEQNESLVPWNFGGYEAMNLAGEAAVVDALSQQQVSEAGSIEVPGAPTVNIGNALLSGGPYVTGLTCDIGINGVTTTYRMETWTPRFGKVYKQNADYMAKLSRNLQAQRRTIREFIRRPPAGSNVYKMRKESILKSPARLGRTSTHAFIGGEILKNEDNNEAAANVVLLPTYQVAPQIGKEYAKRGLMSLDGLFLPFSTNPSVANTPSSGLPHYETPTASGSSGRSVTELNPFQNGHHIAQIIGGSGLADDDTIADREFDNTYRPLALRGPLVIAGWGYDTNGKPVPNSNPSSPTSNFVENYLKKPELWKVGPLDLKWNNTRKVWIGGGGDFEVARLITPLYHGLFASGIKLSPSILMNGDLDEWVEQSGEYIRIYDGLIGTDDSILFPISPSGARVYIQKEASSQQYFVISANVF